VNRDRNGNFTSETGWSGSGGGPASTNRSRRIRQAFRAQTPRRSAPDFSFDADPNSVSVYNSTTCQGLSGWLVFGGTGVSAPSLAGIVNLAGGASSSTAELTTIYSNCTNTNDFRDIVPARRGASLAKPDTTLSPESVATRERLESKSCDDRGGEEYSWGLRFKIGAANIASIGWLWTV
jgi:hypothetical protein